MDQVLALPLDARGMSRRHLGGLELADGGVTGKKDYRYEPETSSGPGEIFVYYTVILSTRKNQASRSRSASAAAARASLLGTEED